MIHDIIAETFPQLTLPKLTARLFWKAKVGLGRRQADAIVTVSDYSRQGIMERFNLSADQVFVVGEASDPVFRVIDGARLTPHLQSLGINGADRIVVYVGGFNPHKNLEPLITAFAKLASRPELSDVRLVMVGEYKKEVFHSYFNTIKQQVDTLGIADKVVFTGYMPDDELVILLNLATVSVLPSLMEGFGLPAVEAAACGCPIIATTASPLPALLGEGGLYINPSRPEELEAALALVLESDSLRQRMRESGIEAASKLTWEAAARQMMNLMNRLGK
jgi:glycosyltransferase involved in cell wall biosynthesis